MSGISRLTQGWPDPAHETHEKPASMEVDVNLNPLEIDDRMRLVINKIFELKGSEVETALVNSLVDTLLFQLQTSEGSFEGSLKGAVDSEHLLSEAQKGKVKSMLLRIQKDFGILYQTLNEVATTHTQQAKRKKESESFCKSRVEEGFIKLQTFLPVAEFSLLETSLNSHLLGTIFETIADSFSFDKDVKKVIELYRNPRFTEMLVLKDETLQTGFEACHALLECILPKLQTIYDESLCCLWRFIIIQKKFNPELKDLDAEKIREFLKTDQGKELTDFVKQLNLKGADMKILPPEINQFSKLEKIFLQNSGVSCFPVILREHLNFCPLEKRDGEKKNWLEIDMG